jgi:hypothetical protein
MSMFYKNKKTNEVVELIYSDNEFCIYVLEDEIKNVKSELNGNIFYGNKNKFKQMFKKDKKVTTQPLESEAVDSIVSTFLFDRKRLKTDSGLDELVVLTQAIHENKVTNNERVESE